MKVFVTGGAGFIGSHTCIELLAAGHDVIIFDNFCNANPKIIDRIQAIAGKAVSLITGDIRDSETVTKTVKETGCEAIIHFAALKSVGESVSNPLIYYDNNVVGTLHLLKAAQLARVRFFIYSSSATVYGDPLFLPLTEEHPLSSTNPYGRTKLVCEKMIRDFEKANPSFCAGVLRYFNPIGAHESGLIGEDPKGIPNNLLPYIAQVAAGVRPFLNIWGGDYDTQDGTGVRDYIHVMDLAKGHAQTLGKMAQASQGLTLNLGTGRGYSVLEIVRAFETASGRTIPYEIKERRPGDIAACYADATKAWKILGWKAEKTLAQMCEDGWRWQKQSASPA